MRQLLTRDCGTDYYRPGSQLGWKTNIFADPDCTLFAAFAKRAYVHQVSMGFSFATFSRNYAALTSIDKYQSLQLWPI